MEKISNSVISKVMVFFTRLGTGGFVWATLATVLLMRKRYRFVSLKIYFALVLTTIMGEAILKRTIGRHRPSENLLAEDLLIKKPKSYSFPSGHTTSSFASAYVISVSFPYLTIPVFCIATIIGFSRIYLRVHYPTDVIAGVFIGFIIGGIVNMLL